MSYKPSSYCFKSKNAKSINMFVLQYFEQLIWVKRIAKCQEQSDNELEEQEICRNCFQLQQQDNQIAKGLLAWHSQ